MEAYDAKPSTASITSSVPSVTQAYSGKPQITSIIDSKPSVTQAYEGNPKSPEGSGSGYRDMIRLGVGEDSIPSIGTGPTPTSNTHYISFANASSQCAYVADSDLLDLTGDFTISFWMYLSGTASGTNYILTKHTASAGERGYQLYYNFTASPNRLTIELHQDDSTNCTVYWDLGQRNTWLLITITCDISNALASKFTLYVNNISQGHGTTAGSNVTTINANTQPLVIGAQTTTGTNGININIDSLKIYNSLQNADNVFLKSTSSDVESGLVGFWKFDNDYTDSSGNSLTLTAVNIPTFNTNVLFDTYGDLYKFYPSLDGEVKNGQNVANRSTVWTTVHGAASGDVVVAGDLTGTSVRFSVERGQAGTNTWIVYRSFLVFDTSSLAISDYIVGAFLHCSSGSSVVVDQSFSAALVNTSQASDTTLVAGDYDTCGDVNNPTEGASEFAITNTSASFWVKLNSTGLSWINRTGNTFLGVRDSNDLSTTTPPHTGTDRTVYSFASVNSTTEYVRPWLGVIKN